MAKRSPACWRLEAWVDESHVYIFLPAFLVLDFYDCVLQLSAPCRAVCPSKAVVY